MKLAIPQEIGLKSKKQQLLKINISDQEREVAITHMANILGRTFNEVISIYDSFSVEGQPERLIHIIYWLGKLAIEEVINNKKRTVTFSPVLRERLGHHIHGEIWADSIKETLYKNQLLTRPIHIISANMHSVMNSLYTALALKSFLAKKDIFQIYQELSQKGNESMRNKVEKCALQNGMIYIPDTSGTNIDVQIFDMSKADISKMDLKVNKDFISSEKPVILVMDYAFGEQAYETMDELLKPIKVNGEKVHLNVKSISIMGKAGILASLPTRTAN